MHVLPERIGRGSYMPKGSFRRNLSLRHFLGNCQEGTCHPPVIPAVAFHYCHRLTTCHSVIHVFVDTMQENAASFPQQITTLRRHSSLFLMSYYLYILFIFSTIRKIFLVFSPSQGNSIIWIPRILWNFMYEVFTWLSVELLLRLKGSVCLLHWKRYLRSVHIKLKRTLERFNFH